MFCRPNFDVFLTFRLLSNLSTFSFIINPCFTDEEEALGSKKKRKKSRVDGGMRKTRGMISGNARGPKGFKDWLDEAELDSLPEGEPSYLTAAAGPPKTRSARKLCSVCGVFSNYTCTRCGTKFCSIRCHTVHSETRCLKFIS